MLRLIFPLLANAGEETAATATSPPEKPNLRRRLNEPVVTKKIDAHTQIGQMVNVLNSKGGNLITQFENVGVGAEDHLLRNAEKKEEGCVVVHKTGAKSYSFTDIAEGTTEIAEMMANAMGVTGGHGPVKASVKAGWSKSTKEETYHLAAIKYGSTTTRKKEMDLNCVKREGKKVFNEAVINRMITSLKDIQDYPGGYPGVGNKDKWETYMQQFETFATNYGTHVKTESYYGALAIQMYNK
jgi:hypothetical protein